MKDEYDDWEDFLEDLFEDDDDDWDDDEDGDDEDWDIMREQIEGDIADYERVHAIRLQQFVEMWRNHGSE